MSEPEVSTVGLDLNDTEVAFRSRSRTDLLRARLLFTVIGNPTISAIGGAISRFALAIGLPVKGLIKSTFFPTHRNQHKIVICYAELMIKDQV